MPLCAEDGAEEGGTDSTSSAPFEGTFPCQGKACGAVGFPPGGGEAVRRSLTDEGRAFPVAPACGRAHRSLHPRPGPLLSLPFPGFPPRKQHRARSPLPFCTGRAPGAVFSSFHQTDPKTKRSIAQLKAQIIYQKYILLKLYDHSSLSSGVSLSLSASSASMAAISSAVSSSASSSGLASSSVSSCSVRATVTTRSLSPRRITRTPLP